MCFEKSFMIFAQTASWLNKYFHINILFSRNATFLDKKGIFRLFINILFNLSISFYIHYSLSKNLMVYSWILYPLSKLLLMV